MKQQDSAPVKTLRFPRCDRGVQNRWNPTCCVRFLGHPTRHRRTLAQWEVDDERIVRAIVVFLTAGAVQ